MVYGAYGGRLYSQVAGFCAPGTPYFHQTLDSVITLSLSGPALTSEGNLNILWGITHHIYLI